MRVLVCGSRSIKNFAYVRDCINQSGFEIDTIIEGQAKGVDTLARIQALAYKIPFEEYPADWDTYGKRAGFIRNEEMVKICDGVIAIWDGKSTGTAHTISLAKKYKKELVIFRRLEF